MPKIEASTILKNLKLDPDGEGHTSFVLLSFHRTENVDNRWIAKNVVEAINEIAETYPVVFPFHLEQKISLISTV